MRKPTTGRFNTPEELASGVLAAVKLGITWRQVAKSVGVSETKAMQVYNEELKRLGVETLKTSPCPAIPQHHIQWFETLKAACRNDNLALISCRDMVTGEPRSVIAILQKDGEDFGFTPLGNLATTDNPFDAYIPPNPEQRSVQ